MTSQYVTGRWWASTSTSDAKQYVLIVSEEPGLEGFKIKKTYPEDDPWYWLYVGNDNNHTRVATNGRQAANGDNFSDWAYAVWQFLPVEDPTGINDVIDGNAEEQKVSGIYTLTGQKVSVPTHGIYIINGKKVLRR